MAEELRYDLESFDIVTQALRELVNSYPALSGMDEIAFSVLDAEGGKAMFPTSGAVIQSQLEDITGNVEQHCLYPFTVVYRGAGLSENRKAEVKEWLDNLGKWLEKQPIKVKGAVYKLDSYPELSGNRKFEKIERTSPAFLFETNEDKVEDWIVSIQARYVNTYQVEEGE